MTQPIWFDSSEVGAPTLNNAAGSLLEILRACLINGFGSKTVTSISVTAGVATATCAAHGFLGTYGKLVLIEGSGEALLNGRKQPGNVLTNSFTYPAPGVADGTYTGTMTAKRAPLGWVEAHTGVNKAIFARSDVTATAQMLRVLDTAASPASATGARVFGVESATDVDTFGAIFPTTAQLSGGQWWYRGLNSASAKRWAIVGDELGFYFAVEGVSVSTMIAYYFGDINTLKATDAFHTMLSGSTADAQTNPVNYLGQVSALGNAAVNNTAFIARLSSQLGSAVQVGMLTFGNQIGFAGVTAPSPVDNGYLLARPCLVSEANAVTLSPIRGVMPGIAVPLANRPFANLSVQSDFLGDDAAYLALNINNNQGNILLAVTGMWR
jgi:hypothetical protein